MDTFLEHYNKFADVVVGWEAEQLTKLLVSVLEFTIFNLDLFLPLLGLAGLYFFKPTRPFVIGTGIIGILLFLGRL